MAFQTSACIFCISSLHQYRWNVAPMTSHNQSANLKHALKINYRYWLKVGFFLYICILSISDYVRLTEAQRTSLVVQTMTTIPEHMSSSSVLKWGLCYSIFSFLGSVLWTIVWLFVFILLSCYCLSCFLHGFWLPPLVCLNIFSVPRLLIFHYGYI